MEVLRGVELSKKIYDKLLSDVARENDITLNELKVLMFLNHNKENNIARNIVEGLGSTKSHVSLSVNNLEDKGYIIKKIDACDKKKNHLELTNKSCQIIKKARNVQKQIKDILVEGLTKEELELLASTSKKMQENLEKYINS